MTTYLDRDTGESHGSGKDLVNSYIRRFSQIVSKAVGSDVRFPPLDDSGFASLSRGSATIGINVLEDTGELLFLVKIMPVPSAAREECFRYLLELNYTSTADGAFAIEKETDSICLRALRSLANMDYEEFENLLDSVGSVADEWDDRLKARFG